jgi:hypothetical protein
MTTGGATDSVMRMNVVAFRIETEVVEIEVNAVPLGMCAAFGRGGCPARADDPDVDDRARVSPASCLGEAEESTVFPCSGYAGARSECHRRISEVALDCLRVQLPTLKRAGSPPV